MKENGDGGDGNDDGDVKKIPESSDEGSEVDVDEILKEADDVDIGELDTKFDGKNSDSDGIHSENDEVRDEDEPQPLRVSTRVDPNEDFEGLFEESPENDTSGDFSTEFDDDGVDVVVPDADAETEHPIYTSTRVDPAEEVTIIFENADDDDTETSATPI